MAKLIYAAITSLDGLVNDEQGNFASSGVIHASKALARPGDTKSYYFLDAQVHVNDDKPLLNLGGTATGAKKQALIDEGEGGPLYLTTIVDWNLSHGGALHVHSDSVALLTYP